MVCTGSAVVGRKSDNLADSFDFAVDILDSVDKPAGMVEVEEGFVVAVVVVDQLSLVLIHFRVVHDLQAAAMCLAEPEK